METPQCYPLCIVIGGSAGGRVINDALASTYWHFLEGLDPVIYERLFFPSQENELNFWFNFVPCGITRLLHTQPLGNQCSSNILIRPDHKLEKPNSPAHCLPPHFMSVLSLCELSLLRVTKERVCNLFPWKNKWKSYPLGPFKLGFS